MPSKSKYKPKKLSGVLKQFGGAECLNEWPDSHEAKSAANQAFVFSKGIVW